MIFSDLVELKAIFQIDPSDHTEDYTLSLYNQWASGIIEEVCDRDFTYKTRTVVYPGTGNQKLLLRHRPVYPTTAPSKASSLPFTAIQVIVDEGAHWGEATGAFSGTPLTYGQDYSIRIDLDDGGSREAILYRLDNFWPRPIQRTPGLLTPSVGPDMGSVQVTTTAGYTIDMLPSTMRMGVTALIAKINYFFPLGVQLSSESYIERSIGLSENQRRYLLATARPYFLFHKNWHF